MGIEGVIYSNVTVDEGRRGGGSGRGRVLAGYWPGTGRGVFRTPSPVCISNQ
jgi:hypothetical protein